MTTAALTTWHPTKMFRAALRLIVTLTLGMLAAPLPARAQSTVKFPRIGVLQVGTAAATQNLFEAFKQGMRERGYVEGQHLVFERRLGVGCRGAASLNSLLQRTASGCL